MSVYLDASILVSLFIIDSQTARADRFLRSGPGAIVVSDFAAAEFAAVVGRKTRTGDVDEREAVFADFDYLDATDGAHSGNHGERHRDGDFVSAAPRPHPSRTGRHQHRLVAKAGDRARHL